MVVPSQHTDARATLPIPNADGLVITCRDNPRIFSMEVDYLVKVVTSTSIIQVAKKSEKTSSEFVIPDFNAVVVATTDK